MLVVKQAAVGQPVELVGTCIDFNPPPRPGQLFQVAVPSPIPEPTDFTGGPFVAMTPQYHIFLAGVVGSMDDSGKISHEIVVELREGDDPTKLPKFVPEDKSVVYGGSDSAVESPSPSIGTGEKENDDGPEQ